MNLELITENLKLIEEIEKKSNIKTFTSQELQVNYRNYKESPEKIKKTISLFKKINEDIPKKYNTIIEGKKNEIIPKIKKIKEDLTKLLENNNNIKINIPKSLSQGNQNKYFNEFKNEYSKRNRDYIDKVSFYLKHFELFITKLNNLLEIIKQNRKAANTVSFVRGLR